MSFPWLALRINEERERRKREEEIRARLPRALAELHAMLKECIEAYTLAFGAGTAEIGANGGGIQVLVHAESAHVDITAAPDLPGFQVEGCGEPFQIEVGILPGDKLFYKWHEQYLTTEQLTKLILDRALFPKLGE